MPTLTAAAKRRSDQIEWETGKNSSAKTSAKVAMTPLSIIQEDPSWIRLLLESRSVCTGKKAAFVGHFAKCQSSRSLTAARDAVKKKRS
jgi:hypothetical protein